MKSKLVQVATVAISVSGATVAAAQVEAEAQAQAGMGLPAAPAATGSDHDRVVGHLGVGYLGRETMQIAADATGTPTPVTAPVVGVRFWMNQLVGIDAGLGFSLTSGSIEADDGTTTTTDDKVGVTTMILHFGVPLSLASANHFSFQIVPETNIGIASATIEGDPPVPDVNLSGFHWDIGARAGAEIQFGFIDIPQLSLQGGIGLALQIDNTKASVDATPETSQSDSTTVIGTNLAGDPWEMFIGNLSAIYYF